MGRIARKYDFVACERKIGQSLGGVGKCIFEVTLIRKYVQNVQKPCFKGEI